MSILLLTGVPGVGKTTLVRRVAARLADRKLEGFYTEEMREGGRRVGFRIVPFSGAPAVMAHVGFRGPHRVGRYGVDVAAVDAAAATLARSADLHLVDEIGKMECFSDRFVEAMGALLDAGRPVVATIARRGGGFIAAAKRHPAAELWEVTRQDRDELVERVLAWIAGAAQPPP